MEKVLVRDIVDDLLKPFEVWADEGSLEIIKSVEGVDSAYSTGGKCNYVVYLDARYSRVLVMESVRNALTSAAVKVDEVVDLATVVVSRDSLQRENDELTKKLERIQGVLGRVRILLNVEWLDEFENS